MIFCLLHVQSISFALDPLYILSTVKIIIEINKFYH